MNAGVSNEYTLTLGLVLAPSIIKLNGCSQWFTLEHRTMQRTDSLNVEGGSLLQDALYLRAILTTDIEIVATSLASPVVSFVNQCSEFAESIGREEHLVQTIVTHNDLWPMHHRSRDKLQFMLA